MTSPSAESDLLIDCASFSLSAVAPVLPARSDPAKSTSESFPTDLFLRRPTRRPSVGQPSRQPSRQPPMESTTVPAASQTARQGMLWGGARSYSCSRDYP